MRLALHPPAEGVTTLNFNGSALTPKGLAWIASKLEEEGAVNVVGVVKAQSLPGAAPLEIGVFLEQAVQARKEDKF